MNKKIIAIIIAVVIIIGIIITAIIGLNYDLRFQNTKRVEVYLPSGFEISDIKEITDETIPNEKVLIQKARIYEDAVSIIAKDITEEQKDNLVNKLNEKYQADLSAEETEIVSIPNTRGRDLVKPYIMPFAISTIIILVYVAIRYIKLNSLKVLLKTICALVLAQAILLSAMAILRLPVGRLTMPLVITVYLLTLIGLTTKFEKELKVKKEEAKKEFSK